MPKQVSALWHPKLTPAPKKQTALYGGGHFFFVKIFGINLGALPFSLSNDISHSCMVCDACKWLRLAAWILGLALLQVVEKRWAVEVWKDLWALCNLGCYHHKLPSASRRDAFFSCSYPPPKEKLSGILKVFESA